MTTKQAPKKMHREALYRGGKRTGLTIKVQERIKLLRGKYE